MNVASRKNGEIKDNYDICLKTSRVETIYEISPRWGNNNNKINLKTTSVSGFGLDTRILGKGPVLGLCEQMI
jgi:hypothetical protein